MVISEDIKYVRYMDDIESAPNLNGDFTGLSIIDFYVVPHYGNFPFKKSTKKIIDEYSDKYDLRPINNSQAIIIDGKKTEILTK
jgi:dipeptidase E